MIQTTTQKVRRKRIKGVGGIIYNLLAPLETNQKFQKKYARSFLRILINAKDTRYAAVLTIDCAKIIVESLTNDNKKILKKKVLNYNAMIKANVPILLDITTGKLGLMGMVMKIITFKMKVKVIRKLLKLKKLFAMADKTQKN